ncbi:hypothetical protein EV361DRAFT_973813 [Lentinula raphanica]|nr:hypothetical protein EV361DRAFT_973813 [Lentinula raphanica]
MELLWKVMVYHFYHSLEHLMDNTGCQPYRTFLRAIWQWRNLRVLKRGGRGNNRIRTVEETNEGELAVRCIACPRPDINLPIEWEKAPPEKHWQEDPSLQDGFSYFVKYKPYAEFCENLKDQAEMSTCTGLSAVDHANTKYSKGYSVTGAGCCTCGCHEVVFANGWSKRLQEWLLQLPPLLRLNIVLRIVKFVIPKLHILGHLQKCQEQYLLLFTEGAGKSDMEGIERICSALGLVGNSMKEMGPASRQETIEDHIGDWNWSKVVALGASLPDVQLELLREEQAKERVVSAAGSTEVEDERSGHSPTDYIFMLLDLEDTQ